MNNIQYGIFCEDIAQSLFIDNFLKLVNDNNFSFIKNNIFSLVFKPGRNRSKVKSQYLKVATDGIANYDLDLIFIGWDLDCNNENDFKIEYQKFSDNISKFNKNSKKLILFIPVQCIEHWLWYLKENVPQNKKLEKYNCSEAKQKVYNRKKTNQLIIEQLTEKIDIKLLLAKSYSFSKFYQDFESFKQGINIWQ